MSGALQRLLSHESRGFLARVRRAARGKAVPLAVAMYAVLVAWLWAADAWEALGEGRSPFQIAADGTVLRRRPRRRRGPSEAERWLGPLVRLPQAIGAHGTIALLLALGSLFLARKRVLAVVDFLGLSAFLDALGLPTAASLETLEDLDDDVSGLPPLLDVDGGAEPDKSVVNDAFPEEKEDEVAAEAEAEAEVAPQRKQQGRDAQSEPASAQTKEPGKAPQQDKASQRKGRKRRGKGKGGAKGRAAPRPDAVDGARVDQGPVADGEVKGRRTMAQRLTLPAQADASMVPTGLAPAFMPPVDWLVFDDKLGLVPKALLERWGQQPTAPEKARQGGKQPKNGQSATLPPVRNLGLAKQPKQSARATATAHNGAAKRRNAGPGAVEHGGAALPFVIHHYEPEAGLT